jgi:hypothetical protein
MSEPRDAYDLLKQKNLSSDGKKRFNCLPCDESWPIDEHLHLSDLKLVVDQDIRACAKHQRLCREEYKLRLSKDAFLFAKEFKLGDQTSAGLNRNELTD